MTLDSLIGRLVLRPGQSPAVLCERPMVGAALLGRLTHDRRAALLPDLLASVFTLSVDAQHSTARRAVMAALGLADGADKAAHDALAIALHAAGDHLHRLALDLPSHASLGQRELSVTWQRDAPVHGLPSRGSASDATLRAGSESALRAAMRALPGWLERRLFGVTPANWLRGWRNGGAHWLAQWAREHEHPVTDWLDEVSDDARAAAWSSAALPTLAQGEDGLRELAVAIDADPAFAESPTWRGAAVETGPWTRHARLGRDPEPGDAWERIGARLADLAAIACGEPLACGALALGDSVGIAWTEMSRGLLVHWVRLQSGERDPYTARVERYHVLAPTEWNFHPGGAFALALASGTLAPQLAAVAAASLDPCLGFKLDIAGGAQGVAASEIRDA